MDLPLVADLACGRKRAPQVTDILEFAKQYAGRGWHVFPVGRDKVPLVKWKRGATTDPRTIEKWWRRWPQANIGIATGSRSGIAVVDVDGPKGLALLQQYGPLSATLVARTGRDGGGRHGYFAIAEAVKGIALDGLELKADGQYVVAVGSTHASGRVYEWLHETRDRLPAPLPAEFVAWMRGQKRPKRTDRGESGTTSSVGSLGARPAWLGGATDLSARATAATGTSRTATLEDIEAALTLIPNPDLAWDDWKAIGMAVFAACEGDEAGMDLWAAWSARSRKHDEDTIAAEWGKIVSSPPTALGFGTLVWHVREAIGDPDWLPPSRGARAARPADEPLGEDDTEAASGASLHFGQTFESDGSEKEQTTEFANGYANGHTFAPDPTIETATVDNPLIELNKKYSVIGDLGGKCLVMSWVPSKVDDAVRVPSFQTFKSFSERYANRYVTIGSGDDKEVKQLGPYWLKWTKRKSFEGIDLVPNGEAMLANNVLNLWSGFAIAPRAGAWPLMQQHIFRVLASGDPDAAWYITKFAAWAVQHPGDRAEVALVFRGGKGSGKGTFANALRRIFGQHGLHIFNSKHLVGSFNGHLRNCLLLFADEAFWAGDKQGESVLKGLITEPTLMIEQKGVDATSWRNRLHIIMAANAEWVVPASRGERRYAVFDVASERMGDREYFRALHGELANGGLAAMLHDLLHLDLKSWHPRDVPDTAALREQKELSLHPIDAWWESVLQAGRLPYTEQAALNEAGASRLLQHLHEHFGTGRETNATMLGRYLRKVGAEGIHTRAGNIWRFPQLANVRKMWIMQFGPWTWRNDLSEWQPFSTRESTNAAHPSQTVHF